MSQQDPVKAPTYVTNTKVQNNFIGSIDTVSSDTQIADNAYLWLINGRNRFGFIDPIKRHVEITSTAPAGKKQGCIAVGNVLILFVGGLAYYQIDGTTTWSNIPGFILDASVDRFWSCAVPSSTFNFVRKTDGTSIHNPMLVTTDFKVSGTPQCVVVQDGINQPNIIQYDITNQVWSARAAGTFDTWRNISATANDREYVPIGKQMFLFNGNTLMIVAPTNDVSHHNVDKISNGCAVYRSITGRPLDFMVNVDKNGNKLASESIGGAATVSFAFDFDFITCITGLNTPDSFVYATAHNVRVLVADYSNTIFGEPTFRTSSLIQAGVVNQRSFVEIVGDYAFVDFEGIISFDAVQQLKFNGRNSIFSLPVSKLMHGIKQKDPCCVVFNNYVIFNIDSVWFNIMAIYDNLLQKWVSFDVTDVIRIKEFAIVETITETKLYCITHYDEVFQLFANPTRTYLTQLKTRSFVSGETDTELKSQNVRVFFNGGTFNGTVTAIEYVDEKSINDRLTGTALNRVTKNLYPSVAGLTYPIRPPVIPNNIPRVDNPSFNFSKGLMGKKVSYIIQWDTDSKLIELQTTISWKKSTSSLQETSKIMENKYANNSTS